MGGKLWADEFLGTKEGNIITELWRIGRAVIYSSSGVDAEAKEIRTACRSNDPHVIGLARISGARILCADDGALEDDFGNKALVDSPRGKVYRRPAHDHLLGHSHGCPLPNHDR